MMGSFQASGIGVVAGHRLSYRLGKGPAHSLLQIWINGAHAGVITAANNEINVLYALINMLELNGATENK